MASKTLNTRIIVRNDTKAAWQLANPVLRKGEVGIVFDPSADAASKVTNFKIGDGVTAWNDLPLIISTESADALAIRVSALEGQVGDWNSTEDGGTMAAIIRALGATVATHTSQITALDEQLNATGGLASRVTATETSITVLNGTAGVAGSVEAKIAAHASDYDAAGLASAAEAAAKGYADSVASATLASANAAAQSYAAAAQTAAIAAAKDYTDQQIGDADLSQIAKNKTNIEALQGVVGSGTTGLVGQVAGLDTQLNATGGLVSRVGTLEGVVGSGTTGLVGQVAGLNEQLNAIGGIASRLGAVEGVASANAVSIATLNGTAGVAGSVAAQVAAEATRATGVEASLDARIDALEGNHFIIASADEQGHPDVAEPQTNVIYLVAKASPLTGYKEWIYVNNAWEEIGDTDIDLSDYYNKSASDARFAPIAPAGDSYTLNSTFASYVAGQASWNAAASGDIAANTSAISANASAISANASAISANASAISVNAAAISANASAISANEAAISINAAAISANASAISANASAISANASAISVNAAAISVNAAAISANASAINAIEADYLTAADTYVFDCGCATTNIAGS